jgi:hypothetical protein
MEAANQRVSDMTPKFTYYWNRFVNLTKPFFVLLIAALMIVM